MRERLVTLLVALVILSSVVGPIALSQPVTAAPDGYVGLASSSVSTDLPSDSSVEITAADLQPMTTDNASTTEVILTTPDRASDYLGPDASGVSLGNGDVAVVIRDETAHDGRRIALDAQALKTALGYRPGSVTGVHDSGERWIRSTSVEAGSVTFAVPHFSSNAVSFTSRVEVSSDGATNGTQSIYQIAPGGLDSVSDLSATATGVRATEWDNETASGLASGSTLPLAIAGSGPPLDQWVTITGEQTTTPWSTSLTGAADGTSKSASVPGNVDPADESATLTGRESSTTRTISITGGTDGTSTSYSNGGNVPSEDVSATITGDSSTTTVTSSGSDGSSLSVGGNLDADGTLTLEGAGSTTTNNYGWTRTGGVDLDLSINGNLDPTGPANGDPQIIVEPAGYDRQRNTDINSAADASHILLQSGDDHVSMRGGYSGGTITEVAINGYDTMNYGVEQVDVYLDCGALDTTRDGTFLTSWDPQEDAEAASAQFDVDHTPDCGDTYELELVPVQMDDLEEINVRSDKYDGAVYDGTEIDEYAPDISVDVAPEVIADSSGANQARVDFGAVTSRETARLNLAADADQLYMTMTDPGSVDVYIKKNDVYGSENPSITLDGTTYSASGIYQSGDTKQFSVSSISPGSYSVSTSTTSGPAPSWSTSLTETTATEDPSITVDGTTVASYSGILKSGESWTKSISNQAVGSHSLGLSLAAHKADVDLSFSEITATEDPGLDLDGDGATDVSHAGILRSGETATVSAASLSEGSTTITATATAGTLDADVSATGRTRTEDPTVSLPDGTTVASYSGILKPGETARTALDGTLTTSSDGLDLQTTDGTAGVTAQFREQQLPTGVRINVNGFETNPTGTLDDGETVTLSPSESWIQEGENVVRLLIDQPTDPDAPTPRAGYRWTHTATDDVSVSHDATVWEEAVTVSKTFASDRTDASLTLPFDGDVVSIETLERRDNGGSWTAVPDTDYSLDNTTLSVALGSVATNDTVDVRATGRKIQTRNGAITVTAPTVAGDSLSTAFVVDDRSSGFALDLGTTTDSVVTLSSSTWSSRAFSRIDASGSQELHLPDANAGSEATVASTDIDVAPAAGAIEVLVEDRTIPQFRLRTGDSSGAERVEIRYLDPLSGESYQLYSVTEDRPIISSDEQDGSVRLTTNGDAETYKIGKKEPQQTGPAVSISGSNESSTTNPLSLIALLGGTVGGLILLVVAGRRLGLSSRRSNLVLAIGGSVIGVVATELVAPGTLGSLSIAVGEIGRGLAGSGAGAILISILALLGLRALDGNLLDVPRWLFIASGIGLSLFVLVNLVDGFSRAINGIAPLLLIVGALGGVLLLWRALRPNQINIQEK